MAFSPEQTAPERKHTFGAFGAALTRGIQANRQRLDAQYDAGILGDALALDNGDGVVVYAAISPNAGLLMLADYRQWPGGQTRVSVELFAGHIDVSGVDSREVSLDSEAAYKYAYSLLDDLLPAAGAESPWELVMQRAGPVCETKKPAATAAIAQVGRVAVNQPAA